MKKLLSHIVLWCLLHPVVFGQGWVTKDVQVVVKDDAHVVIDGNTGNYTNKGTGLVTTNGTGTIHVDGNWINLGTTTAIGNNAGLVILTGGAQTIGGTNLTSFNSLELNGSDNKTLDVNALVGGGYPGIRKGLLILNDKHLFINSNKLIVNNPDNTSITRTSGMLIGDTDPTLGYSTVQWNVRNTKNNDKFTVPFGTSDFILVPFNYTVTTAGTQSADSGFFSVATYPTDPSLGLNNRPLPTGVPHLDNKYKIENDIKSVDRFYMLESNGYGTEPTVQIGFPYVDREWDGSTGGLNDIDETELSIAQYNSSTTSWNYEFTASTNTANNQTTSENLKNISGIWVLHNYPYCPVANYTFANECYKIPVLFTDSSYIEVGVIDTSVWVYENNEIYSQDLLYHDFSSDGYFDIKRKVRGDRGCWDSITKTIQIYPLPVNAFTYQDTCFTDVTSFASTSTSPLGMPLKHTWDISGNTYSVANPIHAFNTVGVKQVTLLTENAFGCFDTLTKELEIQPQPLVDFDFDNICEGQEAFFTENSTSKGTIEEYRWRVKGRVVSFLEDHSQVFNLEGTYPVQLAVRNNFGCSDSVYKQLTVWPKAKAKFDVFPKEVYITDPYVNFVQSSSNANSWEWRFGDLSDLEYGPEVMHQYGDTGLFNVRLIANNDFQCADTFYRTILIKPNIRIFIPNAFSPGPDNEVNKTFKPGGTLHGLKKMEMDIYNRWGELIYHTDDINQPWDGYYMGKLVQEGTYLYLIKVQDVYNDVVHFSGTVNVIR